MDNGTSNLWFTFVWFASLKFNAWMGNLYGIQSVFHRVQLFGRFPRCPSVLRLYPATSVFSKDSLVKTSLPASSSSFEPFKRHVRWTMQTMVWRHSESCWTNSKQNQWFQITHETRNRVLWSRELGLISAVMFSSSVSLLLYLWIHKTKRATKSSVHFGTIDRAIL